MDPSQFTIGTEPARFNVVDLLPNDPEYDVIRRQYASIPNDKKELLDCIRIENDTLHEFGNAFIDAVTQMVFIMVSANSQRKSML